MGGAAACSPVARTPPRRDGWLGGGSSNPAAGQAQDKTVSVRWSGSRSPCTGSSGPGQARACSAGAGFPHGRRKSVASGRSSRSGGNHSNRHGACPTTLAEPARRQARPLSLSANPQRSPVGTWRAFRPPRRTGHQFLTFTGPVHLYVGVRGSPPQLRTSRWSTASAPGDAPTKRDSGHPKRSDTYRKFAQVERR